MEQRVSILDRLAQGISITLHPLLIPTYMLVLLLLVNPFLFGINSITERNGRLTLLMVFMYTFFVPMISVVVMRFLGMMKSLEMTDRTERIGPFLVTGVLYLWVFYNFWNSPIIPTAYTAFMLGVVIALFAAFFVNLFSKISLHAVGMGGLVAMVAITMLLFSGSSFTLALGGWGTYSVSVTLLFIVVIFLAGLVGTCRLFLRAHEPLDLYGGYLVGFTAQLLAVRFFF